MRLPRQCNKGLRRGTHRHWLLVDDRGEICRVDIADALAVGDQDDVPSVDEHLRDLDANREEAAAVVADVQHKPLRSGVLQTQEDLGFRV